MRIVLLGPPGAGKGTQAKILEDALQLSHISTGDIFRENIRNHTALGQQAQAYMNEGKLVPDDVTIAMLWDRLDQEKNQGILLDGFPRTIAQAEALRDGLAERSQKVDAVISIEVDEAVLVERLAGRRVCPKCGATFHIKDNPPKVEGICDVCGTALVQRADDSEETVKNRIAVYKKQTEPLIAYYEQEGNLVHISGDRSVDEVAQSIRTALSL